MSGSVYFLAPDRSVPTGGLRTLYRHVDVLNAAGIRARIVHFHPGFRCEWFENQTPVIAASRVRLAPDDVLVVPEVFQHAFRRRPATIGWRAAWRWGSGAEEMPWQPARRLVERAARIVMLSLNPYNTFSGYDAERPAEPSPYRDPRVLAVMTISRDGERYLQYAFPGLEVVRIVKSVDGERFRPAARKQPIVCFMPRKRPKEVVQVLAMLRTRGALDGFRLLSIEGMSEQQVADAMAPAQVFLSFSHAEGLPRPPMEAMASECVVVGYHGHGGSEYFDPEHSFPIEEGDIVGFARTVEEVLASLRRDPHAIEHRARRARSFMLEHYSRQAEARDITTFWRSVEQGGF